MLIKNQTCIFLMKSTHFWGEFWACYICSFKVNLIYIGQMDHGLDSSCFAFNQQAIAPNVVRAEYYH